MKAIRVGFLLLLAGGLAHAQHGTQEATPQEGSAARTERAQPPLELVETAPVETMLDHAHIADAVDVWPEMFAAATRRIDLAHFYASNRKGGRLESVIRALEAAADRGVQVRFLADEGFYETYPDTLDRLGARENIELRLYDMRAISGGVLHAKYMLVDDLEAFVGSQNFDWRSLEHIQELGLRVRSQEVCAALGDVFELDWRLAADPEGPRTTEARIEAADFPLRIETGGGETTLLTPVFSPESLCPDPKLWDLPHLVRLLQGAERSIELQLLTYKSPREGDDPNEGFAQLEAELRAAAARDVAVRLFVADWCKREGTLKGILALAAVPGIEIRFGVIPPHSGGHIPYARVVHSKYLCVDGTRAWIGTSNWSYDYFFRSRNVGFVLEGGPLPPMLERYFGTGWNSPYAQKAEPGKSYEPPRIGD